MSIKQNGGVFGRNPTFNDVTIEGDLIINGEVFTGLDFQGSWNASTNSPSLASSTGTNGEFYIVSVAGTTNLNGITNWGIGDWAIFNGTVWQRVEGGADGNFNDLTANSLTVNSGTTNTVATFTSTDAGAGIQLTDPTGSAKVEASGVNLRVSVDDDAAVANSAIQFRVDGGTKATIDANGNLDVTGDVSIPNGNLSVGGGNITTPQDGAIQMATVTSASGDLWTGINTGANAYSSMPSELSIMNTADNTTNSFAGVFFQAGENSAGAGINSARIGAIRTGSINTDLAFATRGSSGMVEAMRIDSVGNLLVASTSAANSTAGFRAYSGGNGAFTSSATSLSLNRLSSDGEILAFQKDTATVGSIGTAGGDLNIGTGDTGLQFWDGGDSIYAFNTSTNSGRDAAVDLGSSGVRFKDAYLSGGVYLGGTGAANKLDDYEEGTWTPVFKDSSSNSASASTATGTYVKIGSVVHIQGTLIDINTSGLTGGDNALLAGFPFTINNSSATRAHGLLQSNSVTFTDGTLYLQGNNGQIQGGFKFNKTGAAAQQLVVNAFTSGSADVFFSMSYQTTT